MPKTDKWVIVSVKDTQVTKLLEFKNYEEAKKWVIDKSLEPNCVLKNDTLYDNTENTRYQIILE